MEKTFEGCLHYLDKGDGSGPMYDEGTIFTTKGKIKIGDQSYFVSVVTDWKKKLYFNHETFEIHVDIIDNNGNEVFTNDSCPDVIRKYTEKAAARHLWFVDHLQDFINNN